jgi:hypothetical protein
MRRVAFRGFASLAALAQACVCMAQQQGHSSGTEPIVTMFCEIVLHGERFDGRTVRFRASVVSDGIDHTALADPKCGTRTIIPRISEEASDRTDIQKFRDAVFLEKPRGTAFKQVSATFTGTFTVDGKVRVLQVEKVEELTVTHREAKPSKTGKNPK